MNTDYNTTASGENFAPIGILLDAVSTQDTIFTYYALITQTAVDIQVGMSMLIEDEIVGIEVMTDTTFTVKRGCFDTIPAAHAGEAQMWIIDGFIGTDLVPYMGTEQIGIKLLPKTSTALMPIAYSPPIPLTMQQRMIRPYNVGQFHVNGAYWDLDPELTALAPTATLTWVERNRVVQADQLVGYVDASVAAETGTTYHFHLYKPDGTAVAEYDNIATGFVYSRPMAVIDFDLVPLSDTGDFPIYGLFYTLRDGYTSLQAYRVDLKIDTTALTPPVDDGGVELREDGGRELREDGGLELREDPVLSDYNLVLREDGTPSLREDGSFILRE